MALGLSLAVAASGAKADWIVETFDGYAGGGLAGAHTAIATTPLTGSGTFATIDFWDGSGTSGHFGPSAPFPGFVTETFALHATGFIDIAVGGTYTFGTNNDDGVQVRVDGADIIVDDSTHPAGDFFGSTFLSAGVHEVELVFFEEGGGATIELFFAAGTHTAFSGAFALLEADGEAPVSEPAILALFGAGLLGIGVARRRRTV